MMDLSKTLQEDIRINQINLKAAIQNHQALVVKLSGNVSDPSEVKLKLAGIQKHIISLGEAQKVLLARVRKEIAANNNSWTNHTSDSKPTAELRVYPPSANCLEASRKLNSTFQKRTYKAVKEVDADEDEERKCARKNFDERRGDCASPPIKRVKTILHGSSRPSSPALTSSQYDHTDALASSSDDSQESLTIDTSSEPSKTDFLAAVGLVNREELLIAKSKNCERRRRRHAGHHSQYSSHWDLTTSRRHRPKLDQDKEDNDVVVREELSSSPATATSPAIIEVKKETDCSSGSASPVPSTNDASSKHQSSLSPDRTTCTICRKRGILSVCDICSTAFHWFCLDKGKTCPQCQACQTGDSPSPFQNGSDASVSKVLGDTSKPPVHVSSTEVIARYYKRNPSTLDNSNYAERLKFKRMLEARKETMNLELASLEKKATELSAALVSQTENIKKLTAGEEKTKEKIKKIIDIIEFFKAAPS